MSLFQEVNSNDAATINGGKLIIRPPFTIKFPIKFPIRRPFFPIWTF